MPNFSTVAHAPSRGLERLVAHHVLEIEHFLPVWGTSNTTIIIAKNYLNKILRQRATEEASLHLTTSCLSSMELSFLPVSKIEIKHFVSYSVRDSATEDHSRKLLVAR